MQTKEELDETVPAKRKCTFLFNVILTLLCIFHGLATWLFADVNNKISNFSDLPWERLPWDSKYLQLSFIILNLFILLSLGSLIIMLIWNRLIANLFKIRTITYAEAYTALSGLMFLADFYST